jgi:hypothetical protein
MLNIGPGLPTAPTRRTLATSNARGETIHAL